jgi:hypothetical protein
VEIEIGVLASQCLDRRIESFARLVTRPPPGRTDATPSTPESTGCSQPKKRAPKWPALIRSRHARQNDLKESKPL